MTELEDLSLRYSKNKAPKEIVVDIPKIQKMIADKICPPIEEPVYCVEVSLNHYFVSASSITSNPDVAACMNQSLASKVLCRLLAKYPKAKMRVSLDVWWRPKPFTELEDVKFVHPITLIRTAVNDAIADGHSKEEILSALKGKTS